MSTIQPELSWPSTLRNACSLWLKLRLAEDDRVLSERKSIEIRYVTDVDVIKLFVDPATKCRYALLLGLMDEYHLTILGHILSHVFFFGPPSYPSREQVLIVPPHDEEVAIVYEAAKRDALAEAEVEIPVDKVAAALRRAAEYDNIDEILTILDEFPVLSVLFGDRFQGRLNELARWHELFGGGRVNHIERESWYREPERGDQQKWIDRRTETWYRNLAKAKRGRAKSMMRITRDARALAHIEWINRELDIEDSGIRLRFVTGDLVIQDIADKFFSGHRQNEHFVRDPRIFLSGLSDTLIFGSSDQRYGVHDWLRVFLSPLVARDGKIDDSRIRSFANSNSEFLEPVAHLFSAHHGEERLQQAKVEWEEFVTRIGQGFGLQTTRRSTQAREIIDAIGGDMADVIGHVRSKVIQVVTDLSTTSAIAGLFVKKGIGVSLRKGSFQQVDSYRMPAAIRFLDHNFMQRCYLHLSNAVAERDLDKIDIVDIGDKYATHLVYALFFAASGDWRAAANLCRAADLLINEDPYRLAQEKIEGHESLYLFAVAMRHLADKPEELSDAKKALDAAEQRWQEEGHGKIDPRFQVERIAQRLFEINYEVFKKSLKCDSKLQHELERVQAELIFIMESVVIEEKEESVFLPLLKQICVNNLQCAILLVGKCGSVDQETKYKACRALDKLDQVMDQIEQNSILPHGLIYRSLFVKAVTEVARCLLMPRSLSAEMIENAAKAVNEAAKALQKPYDAERFEFFAQLITGLRKK